MDPVSGAVIAEEVATHGPKLIINQVQQKEDQGLGQRIASAYRDYFGIQAESLGALPSDDQVRNAVRIKRPVLEAFPQSSFAKSIREITRSRLKRGEIEDAD
jgi:flagellar biosynthesis protein FlhG